MRKYNIGLDIGVGSIGWCVTDEENNLIKTNNKNLWGSRIFEEANTAKDTRVLRSSRRRLDRRKERINILQDLLQDDMDNIDENFFQILKETSLDYEDKNIQKSVDGIKHNLFSTKDYNDMNF